MRKLFLAFLVFTTAGFSFLLPLQVSAQTVPTTEDLLKTKIQLLQLQVELLQAQISLLLSQKSQPSVSNCAQLNVSWERVSGSDSYRLYRDGFLIYEGSNTSFTDSGLAAGKKYTYVVSAVNQGKEGQPSEIKEITTPNICPPQAPILNFAAQPCGGNLTLSWKASPTAIVYQLQRGTQEIYKGPLTLFVDSGLAPNFSYEYRSKAGNNSGWSDFSVPVTFQASNVCAPQALEVSPLISESQKEGTFSVLTNSYPPQSTVVKLNIETGISNLYPTLEAWSKAGTSGTYASVMAFSIKADFSDITVTRVDLFFDTRPWLYLEKAKLDFGYLVSVEKEISQQSVLEIETGSIYQLRFDGFSARISEGQTVTVNVMIDPNESTLGSLPKDINVFLENGSIRGIDQAGISHLAPLAGGGKGGAFSRIFKIEVP